MQARFRFTAPQIVLHVALISLVLLSALYLVVGEGFSHPPPAMQASWATQWIGLYRDSHDEQWQAFRSNLPVLVGVMALDTILRRLLGPNLSARYCSIGIGVSMSLFAFRVDFLLYISIVMGWYIYTQQFHSQKHFIPCCWAIMILTLLLNQHFDHFRGLSHWLDSFWPGPSLMLSQYRGIHCSQLLNMTFLKLLSYSSDLTRPDESLDLQLHMTKCPDCQPSQHCQKGRNYFALPCSSLRNYLSYIFFAPTLLTGPPISYKNYHSFEQQRLRKPQPRYWNWLMLVCTFEAYQHLLPVLAISQSQSLLVMQLASLFHLIFIWYKFVVIWRTCKLWAELAGVSVVENMGRCIINNYGFQGFWRMWHKGFNQWLVRYLYIPLGGNTSLLTTVRSTLCVVAFVAFWHDHTPQIVLWALLLAACFIPEILVKRYFRTYGCKYYHYHWFKYLAAVASACYIYLLVVCNLIGFGYGIDNARLFLAKLQTEWAEFALSLLVVTSAVILMFYQRDQEQEKLSIRVKAHAKSQ